MRQIGQCALVKGEIPVEPQPLKGLGRVEPGLPQVDNPTEARKYLEGGLQMFGAKRGGGSGDKQVVEIGENKNAETRHDADNISHQLGE